MTFYNWMLTYGLSEKSAASYQGAINNYLSSLALENNITSNTLNTILDSNQFKEVSLSIQKLEVFRTKNSKGNSMYSNALNRYSDYLLETTPLRIENEIKSNPNLKSTEKIAIIQARVGQGKFRDKLIELWGCCSATGYKDVSLLIASHIKPWSKSNNTERLDKHNGLLLTPNLDKAFDSGKISFDESGKVIISKSLKESETLGIYDNLCIAYKSKNTEKHMAYHRKNIFND